MFDLKLDVLEDDLLSYDHRLLDAMLIDKSTHQNIIWATDDYLFLGEAYGSNKEILPDLITGEHAHLVRPRVSKSSEAQISRTRDKAEVFTPCWVCNAQNNLIDAQWFEKPNVFNTEDQQTWQVTTSPILFPPRKNWKSYIDARRLEVSCGEAPYLVSRYDSTTGEIIPISERIGLLDRKLRVVTENTDDVENWFNWALRAFQSVYGYEFQGDSLLLARENLLATFIEYFQHLFHEEPSKKMLLKIANVISWNLWQMDGLKQVVPFTCKVQMMEIYSMIAPNRKEIIPCPGCDKGDIRRHNGVYCRVFDWRAKKSLRFVDLMKGGMLT